MLTKLTVGGIAAFILGSAFFACSDAENVVTCADVCNRYQECINKDYDVAACTNSCQAEAGSTDEKQANLNSCSSCIEDRSCASAVFNCTTECASVIP